MKTFQLSRKALKVRFHNMVTVLATSPTRRATLTIPAGEVSQTSLTQQTTPRVGGNPIILTETGWYPHETSDREGEIERLKEELNNASNLEGALIFDIFGSNPQFDAQSMSDEEIQNLCDNNCQSKRIGGNSAVYYYNDPSFTQKLLKII